MALEKTVHLIQRRGRQSRLARQHVSSLGWVTIDQGGGASLRNAIYGNDNGGYGAAARDLQEMMHRLETSCWRCAASRGGAGEAGDGESA